MDSVYSVYVKTDEKGRVIEINSDAFIEEFAGWVKVDEGTGDKYHHAQGNYLPLPIVDDRLIYRYKLVDGVPVERTQEEMDADYIEPKQVPSQLDIIEAQVTYTAMMTDTLLEG